MNRLPTIATPTYETKLISSNKKVSFRPFLVKEEKILLIAMESEDQVQIAKAIHNLLKNCILSEEIDVNNLASFDAEYLFLKIREKSLGEIINVNVTCPETNKKFDTEIDLSKIKVEKNTKHNNDIKVTEDVGMIMKYPTFSISQQVAAEKSSTERVFKIIINCIEKIYDKDSTYDPNNFSHKELMDFIESFPQSAFEKINKFYESFPKIVYEDEVVSPFTSEKVKVRLENFMDFFG
jgi:hypothetical protein